MNDEAIQRAQSALIDKLKAQYDIEDPRLEAAFRALPRHVFLPGVEIERVYEDAPIVTRQADAAPSSCSQPAVVARLLSMLELAPGANVLEIGAGTGWAAALAGHVVGSEGRVTTIDFTAEVAEEARVNLAAAGVSNVTVITGDGGLGYAANGPYDAILATVGVWDIPPQWLAQLKVGGRIVLPFWLNTLQFGAVFVKTSADNVLEMIGHCGFLGFIRLRGAFAGEESFYREGECQIDSEISDPQRLKKLMAVVNEGPRHLDFPLAQTAAERQLLCEYLALTGQPYIGLVASKERHGFSFGNGIAKGDSLAILPTSPCGPELPKTIAAFGGPEALDALHELAKRWDAEGRPGLHNVRMKARPVSSKAAVTTFRKTWMEYDVWWEPGVAGEI